MRQQSTQYTLGSLQKKTLTLTLTFPSLFLHKCYFTIHPISYYLCWLSKARKVASARSSFYGIMENKREQGEVGPKSYDYTLEGASNFLGPISAGVDLTVGSALRNRKPSENSRETNS